MIVKLNQPIKSAVANRTLRAGTKGDVLGIRDQSTLLVKFQGASWPLQVRRDQIEVICNEGFIVR